MNNRARKTQRESEAAANSEFYNNGPGSVFAEDDGRQEVPKAAKEDRAPVNASLSTVVIDYAISEEQIAGMGSEYADVSFDTPEGYERGRVGISRCRALRGTIEKTRVALKADSLAFGKRVDSTAKHFTGLVVAIEEPLQAQKDAADRAKADARRAKEDAEREAIRLAEQAKLDEQRAALEAQQAELAAQQEAQRLTQEAEALQQAEERLRLDAERAAQAAERVALEAEREAMRAERALAEQERLAAIPAPPITQEAVDAALVESMAPPVLTPDRIASAPPPSQIDWVRGESQDSARLRAFAASLRNVPRPAVDSDTAAAVLEQVEFILSEAVQALESFGEKEAATAAE